MERESQVDAVDKPWWLTEHTLAETGLDSLQIVRLLEWFAQKIWIAREEGSGDHEYCGKSYDPLSVEISGDGGGVAYSYVFNFDDGGRSHDFDSLTDLEQKLTVELVGVVEWAMGRGREDALEGMARYLWLQENPGTEQAWDSYGGELLWRQREPYYDRARIVIAGAKAV